MSNNSTPKFLLGQSVFYDYGFEWNSEAIWSGTIVGYRNGQYIVKFDYCVVPVAFQDGQPGPQGINQMICPAQQLKERTREPGDNEKTRLGLLKMEAWLSTQTRLKLLANAKARIKMHELCGHFKVGNIVQWTEKKQIFMELFSYEKIVGVITSIDANYICDVALADGSSKKVACIVFVT
jgi:hypothetical protein